ncbi:MAG: type I DNA topoisomerase [Bacteroidales bacterium]
MQDNLVIVESPAKAKTIEKFLGKDFLVKSSFGHIRDLAKKDFGVDIANGYTPQYIVADGKEKVVAELKKSAKGAKTVWLASDEDREGEAIAWHLQETLKLDPTKTKRIVFHEITKSAILNAIENPRQVNQDLVDAQQARRVLDRLVGFELSPILWKKVKSQLSAGRVQSVAVRVIVDREREIQKFLSEAFYKIVGNFKVDKSILKGEISTKFKNENEARSLLEKCATASFNVQHIEKKPAKKSPSAPFTTSTLQQEASRKLGFSVAQTMSVAQRLYEAGYITYMRTDSVNLSEQAIASAKSAITNMYGEEYLHTRRYSTKTKGAQEAHEAIRPSYLDKPTVGDVGAQEKRLYELIWKRTIASQMSDAKLERTIVDIAISNAPNKFVATGEVLLFDGFLKVYMESKEEDEEGESAETEGLLPALTVGQDLLPKSIVATQRFSQRPARYTEASLVKKLEELGIGRPSTYAPTISTVINRGYILKEDREGTLRQYLQLSLIDGKITDKLLSENTGVERSKLFPSDVGMVVTDFLSEHFPKVMDYSFTAKVEEEFDEIAQGSIQWSKMIDGFYKPFHKTVEHVTDNSERANVERILGTDPKSGKPILVRIARFGPVAQIGQSEDDEKPQYANLQKGQLIETITLEEALKLFELPRTLGDYEEAPVSVAIGRFGPYVKHSGKFTSLKRNVDDPMSITLERAIELIEEKRKQEREKLIKTFPENPDLQVLNGRYGPYFACAGVNYKIPKGTEPSSLTFEQCTALMEEQKDAPKKSRFGRKKVVATKTPAKKTAVKKKATVKKTTRTTKTTTAKK